MPDPLKCFALIDVSPPAYSRTGGRVLGLFWRRDDAEKEAEVVMGRGDGADTRICEIDAPSWMPVALLPEGPP